MSATDQTDASANKTRYELRYDSVKVNQHPEFRVLSPGETPAKDANIACAYNQHQEIHLINKPRPVPSDRDVLVHVKATGICGSDCHLWKHGRIGDGPAVADECTAGHESAGEIIEVGPRVTKWKVGDRVAIEAGVPCGACNICLSGRYNACPNVVFFSAPPYHGTLTRFHAHPQDWLHRLPDNVSFEEGSLCEPLAVALGSIERANLRLGDQTLICGAGPIGLVSLLAAHAAGAAPIVITDVFQSRLDFAKKLVPRVRTLLVGKSQTPKELAKQIERTAGGKVRTTLECTGVESSVTAAIYATQFGGKVFVIGVGKSEMKFPFGHLSANEIDLGFEFRYANQYPKAIRLVSEGLIDLKPLVTHRFPLAEAVAAFHVAVDPSQGAIKVQIQD